MRGKIILILFVQTTDSAPLVGEGQEISPREEVKKKMQYDNLPKALRNSGKFCIWKYEERQGQEKPAKVPHQTNGKRAQPNNEKTFTIYAAAVEVVNRYDGLGIGIFNDFSAIDINHCINEDGTLSPLSKAIVEQFDGCYIEKSPSGKGLRILFKASGFKYNTAKYYINNTGIGVEVYVCGATKKFVTKIPELDAKIIREFIDRIIVFKTEKINGRRTQRIQISYNCIGEINIPEKDEKTA